MFNDLDAVKKYKTAHLNEILDAYKSTGIEIPELTNNGQRAEFIELTAKESGVPVIVTAEMLEANPSWSDNGVEVGKFILIDLDEVLAKAEAEKAVAEAEAHKALLLEELSTLVEGTTEYIMEYVSEAAALELLALEEMIAKIKADKAASKAVNPPGAVEKEHVGGNTTPEQETAPKAELDATEDVVAVLLKERKIVHEGQVIIAINNRVANGRLFKELDCGASRFTVSIEEFNTIVAKAQ